MARKNKKKLNRERRLAAEARQRAAALLRRNDPSRIVAEKADAVLRRDRAAVQLHMVWETVHALLVQANIPASTRDRVRQLYEHTLGWLPHMTDVGNQSFFLLLARQEWVRPLADFRPPTGGWRRKRDALVLHLLADYAVPRFLVDAVEVEPCWVARVPVEDEWAFAIVAFVGQGGSLRKAGPEIMPAPLTRRMTHDFLAAKAGAPPVFALRRAQVLGVGADVRLARALMRTGLGRLHGPDPLVGEPFVQRLIGWIAARPDFPPDGLEGLVGWALAEQRTAVAAGGELSLKGRTVASVVRDVEAWIAIHRADEFELGHGSGLVELVLHSADGAAWTFHELRTARDLAREGRSMAHCVGMYKHYVEKGKTAIFSLRRAGERRATIEVALASGLVVQAKGKANRAIDAVERQMLDGWACVNRVGVKSL